MVGIVAELTGHTVSKWVFGFLLFVIYVPLCFIRKIEILAPTHVFADIMIIITLTTLMVYAGMEVNKHGFKPVVALNEGTFLDAIGSAVYSYEGIGVVLPIYEVTKNPERIAKNLTLMISVVLFIYIVFGFLMLFAYGDKLAIGPTASPIITETISRIEKERHPG